MTRSRSRSLGALLAASCLAPGCGAGTSAVLGRSVTLVPSEPHAAKPKGELLAVEGGRIWLRAKDGTVSDHDASAVREVRVGRHGFGGGMARRVGLVGGVVSGIALGASCASVEGNSAGGCAAVGFGVGAIWAVTGLLASPGLDASAQARVSPEDLALRAFARFPAGLPKDVPPASLGGAPSDDDRR